MAICNIDSLLEAGKCFSCLTSGQMDIVELQLLCELVAGSSSGLAFTSGVVNPETNVTGNVNDLYWNSITGELFRKNSGAGTNTGWYLMRMTGISSQRPRRNWGMLQASPGTSGVLSQVGIYHQATGTASLIAGSTTVPPMANFLSAATTNSDCGTSSGGNMLMRFQTNNEFAARVALASTAVMRVVIGLFDQNVGNPVSADAVAGNAAWFRYSSAVDANWKCCTRDNVTTNVLDSGIAVDTNEHDFQIRFDPNDGLCKFFIDGVQVQSTNTNLPNAVTCQHGVFMRTLENVAKNIRVNNVYVEYDQW